MNDLCFENIKKIGNLYIIQIFLEFENEPILFLCNDEDRKKYLCLCSEIRKEQKWIIVECKQKALSELLSKEIDIRTAFLKERELTIVKKGLVGKEESFVIKYTGENPVACLWDEAEIKKKKKISFSYT